VSASDDIVRVHRAVLEELLAEARREPDLECCGLLAGSDAVISTILPARNALRSGTSYEIAPEELFALFRRMRAGGLEHLGVYHSHPRGENAPSPRDIDSAFYPAATYFILSPRPDAPRPVRAFQIAGGQARELHFEAV
jgi:proteasome lid subunit RPN8/RPN11